MEGKQFKGVTKRLLGKKGNLCVCCISHEKKRNAWGSFSGLKTNTGLTLKINQAKAKGHIVCNCFLQQCFLLFTKEGRMLVHIPNAADGTREEEVSSGEQKRRESIPS